MSELRIINPPGLAKPSGYSYAIESGGGRMIHFAGHTAMTADGAIEPVEDLPGQFLRTLENLRVTAQSAQISLEDFARLRVYVTDLDSYKQDRIEIGEIYRQFFGVHYPAMTLLEISRLWDDEALIEIEGTAVARSES